MANMVKSKPSQELLNKVQYISATKARAVNGQELTDVMSKQGIHCEMDECSENNAARFTVKGRWTTKLRFSTDPSGLHVRIYKPGDWEQKIVELYDDARRLQSREELEQEVERLAGTNQTSEPELLESLRTKVETWVSDNGEDNRILTVLGTLSMAIGDYQSVERVLKRAISLNPSRWEAYHVLGTLYFSAAHNTIRPIVETVYREFVAQSGLDPFRKERELMGDRGKPDPRITPEALRQNLDEALELAKYYFTQGKRVSRSKEITTEFVIGLRALGQLEEMKRNLEQTNAIRFND